MARLARTRLAGTLAVTTLCVATATRVAAQDPSLVLNQQLQMGDVIAGQQLEVHEASEQVNVSVAAQGNRVIGAAEGQALDVVSNQDMHGTTHASANLSLGGQTEGVVISTVQAQANAFGASATNTALDLQSMQNATGTVVAQTRIAGDQALMAGGGVIASAAIANSLALSASGTTTQRATLTGSLSQTSSGQVAASTRGSPRWVRDDADFSSQAIANGIQVNSGPNSNQELTARQVSRGPVSADTGIYTGNGWNLAARANAVANSGNYTNQGGSLIISSEQDNSASVLGNADLSSYDFGKATAIATASGNEVSIGNYDVYLDIDNTQINTGGVEATASFTGQQGYDAYVGANAVGNSVTGYVCADCAPNMNIINNQTNSAPVSAIANTVINGSGRHVITGTTAIGNAATFYTARPGG